MQFEQITIIGVGLMGGSVGLACKSRGVARRIVGVDRDAATIAKARELGVIDDSTTSLIEAVRNADLIVVGTPVDRVAELLITAAPHTQPRAIFSDLGSTKNNIVRALANEPEILARYVPAHPLAGAERNGVAEAKADLYANRVTILTPERATRDAVRTVAKFWESLGSQVIEMNAAEHDRVLAVTSHLPHAVASAVAGITAREWLKLSAGGFRDVTRIAAGDPNLWTAIFSANRDAVLAAITAFTTRLSEFRTMLEADDRTGLARWLAEGKQVRDALGT
jgi:prephenate dehydrogenase